MDLITKNSIGDFLKSHEIESESESNNFERFSNFSVISEEYGGQFEIDTTLTDPNLQGIDGLGIIVNGKLVDDVQEVLDLIELNGYLEVKFVFIQSKTSSGFDGTQIGNFIFSVKEFFKEESELFNNKGRKIENFLKIKKKIIAESGMLRANPELKLYYVTTGTWVDDTSLLAVINSNVNELKGMNLFEEIKFIPVGAKELQKLYRKTKEQVSATITFEKKITTPTSNGVKEAYYGILPFQEYRKILEDDNGKIRNIFYDNIRDFLGDNDVNQKIDKTLKDGNFDSFIILNNGVTIVATSLKPTGDKFTIFDFQIVNGCQTSHVLYKNRGLSGINNVFIPVRLIVTEDEGIKNQITKATNSQTEIKPEQLEALSEFQRNLETYYNSKEGDTKLFYERRTGQYNSDNSITKTRIISIPTQIKVFSSMFLENPNLVAGYYGTVAKKLGQRIFNSSHKLSPYFISGLAYYKLETLFRTRGIDTKYKIVRFHILMIIRVLIDSSSLPKLGSNDMDRLCVGIEEKINDTGEFTSLVNKAIEVINSSQINLNRATTKRKETTDTLKRLAIEYSA